MNGDEIEEMSTPELLHRERGKDDPGGAQLAVASAEEPDVNSDPGRGNPDHPVRPRKSGKAQCRGNDDISWPRRKHWVARAEKTEDDVPRHILKDADGSEIVEHFLKRDRPDIFYNARQLVQEKDYGSPNENVAA